MIKIETEIKEFEKWYYANFIKGNYTSYGEYGDKDEIHNFIEKMAIWYELRYPDFEIIKDTKDNIDDIMFNDNKYINFLLSEYTNKIDLKWSDFYNYTSFYKSLSNSEKKLLYIPKYNGIVYLDSSKVRDHFHLNDNGYIMEAEVREGSILDCYNSFNRKVHIKELLDKLKQEKIKLPFNNEIEPTVKYVDMNTYKVNGLLDCVMYRIIERGNNRIGSRRALMFAKEFNRNIDIPMIFGVDTSDPNLCDFIDEYIELGGNLDLECYLNYYEKEKKYQRIDKVFLRDVYIKELGYKQKRIEMK